MLAGGMALGEGLQKYTYRYPRKKCVMVTAQGAPRIMCMGVLKRVKSNLKMNGFDNLGNVVISSTYGKKKTELPPKVTRYIDKICNKL